ncbi:MAG: outer membrane protein assembly factor BamC [Hydrogenophaga sp.]|jgi:outer membrane protein assembly factor BamC|nr:outer membrane protein assembly factor BamC [Hydrogenophaga sp.]
MKHTALRRAAPSALRWVALAASLSLLSACSVLQEDKVDYTTAKRGNDLEVPPDLTQLSRQSRYALPSDVVSASGLQNGTGAAAPIASTAPQTLKSFTLERAGSQRWLVAQLPADQLWGPVRDFWKSNGFELTQNDEALGIMETDWAENRAKLPQDFIRSTIGKLFDGLYSTGERDKYRTRLERRADGGTEIYISHRGMQEVYTDSSEERTAWQPRPADPELEAEFLRRLMVSLGATPTQAAQALEQAKAVSAARLVQRQDKVWAEVGDGFDRAWRRVGLALDRTGFTVEERNRTSGTYNVRFIPLVNEKSSGSWFSKKPEVQPVRYQIVVQSDGPLTRIQVQSEQGQVLNDANALRILNVLVNDLK